MMCVMPLLEPPLRRLYQVRGAVEPDPAAGGAEAGGETALLQVEDAAATVALRPDEPADGADGATESEIAAASAPAECPTQEEGAQINSSSC